MSKRGPVKLSNQILEEATDWFIEIRERPQDAGAREAFYEWLRTSPEHVRAFLQIAAHWEEDAPRPSGALESIDELLAMARAANNVVPLMPSREERQSVAGLEILDESPRKSEPRRRRPLRWIGAALAASMVVAFVSLAAHVYLERGVYSTDIGEQRSVRLEDGSTVEINARSRIKVRYGKNERRVDLLEGQALFRVAKDTTRPFTVRSDDVRVRAVGTQFDVYRKRNGTVVTVVEGRVAVHADRISRASRLESKEEAPTGPVADTAMRIDDASARNDVLLGAGEQLTLTPSADVEPQRADISVATAWTQRRLVFVRTPLSEVVEEFNRYNAVPLVISDSSIAGTQISGSFSSGDPTSLLRFLRDVGAYSVDETGSAIVISGR